MLIRNLTWQRVKIYYPSPMPTFKYTEDELLNAKVILSEGGYLEVIQCPLGPPEWLQERMLTFSDAKVTKLDQKCMKLDAFWYRGWPVKSGKSGFRDKIPCEVTCEF